MSDAALHTSALHSLPLLARGKVRDNYAVGAGRILMVASDRISAFDVIMGEPIPGKGALLTQMALWWFEQLKDIVPNHLTGEAPESVVAPHEVAQVAGRIDQAPAGGDILGVLFTVFIVLLVTDILGLTKVFPFTRSVR